MRIAFIVNGFPLLSETFILNQITGLLDRGHEVHIFPHTRWNESKVHADVGRYNLLKRTYYLTMDGSMLDRKVTCLLRIVYLLSKNIRKNPKVLREVLKILNFRSLRDSLNSLYPIALLLDKGPYDVVHSHFGSNGNLALYLKNMRAFEAKIITTFHGHDLTLHIATRGHDIYDNLFKKGDLFMPISQVFKDRLIKLGCDERKIVLHRVGVDTNRFCYFPRKWKTDSKIRLVTIARLVEIKGVEYGIQAVANVLKKYKDIEYRIAGDGPLRNNLERLIEELEVGDNITLLGWQNQEEVRELLRDTDILLAPSVTGRDGNQEGIPVVLMEAMAQGIPVITTRHSGIPELVQDGESGFLVPERDAGALQEKLEYLIKHPETWSEMGRKGRSYVEEHYDLNKQNDRLVEIYQQLQAGTL